MIRVIASAVAITLSFPRPSPAQVDIAPGALPETPLTIRTIEVVGLDLAPVRLTTGELPLRPGAGYSLPRLQSTLRLITRRFAEAGYPFAAVTVGGQVFEQEGVADLRIEVRPGPQAVFGPVNIQAETPVREAEVLERLAFRPGEPFRVETLEYSAERLARIPVVEQVSVHAVPAPVGDSLLATTFILGTGRTRGMGLEGSFSSSRCLEGRVGMWNRHLFGEPRTLSLSVGGANLLAEPLRRFPCTGAGEGEFADPDYFVRSELREPVAPATWLILDAEFSRLSAPQAFIRRGVQLRAGVMHVFARGLEGVAAIAPERRDNPAGSPIHCGVFGVCDGIGLAELRGFRTHVPLEATITWRTPLIEGIPGATPASPLWMQPAPRRVRASLRSTLVAAGGGDHTYAGGILEGSTVRILGDRVELAGRIRAGGIAAGDDPLPLQVRLYGGGVLGVRGVEPNRLGPKILTIPRDSVELLGCPPVHLGCDGVAVDPRAVRVRPTGGNALLETSAEVRLAAARWLQLAIFLDFGMLGSGAAVDAPARVAASESILSPGVGALLVTPLGPIRVDFAFDPTPGRLYPLLTTAEDGEGQTFLGQVGFDPFTFDAPSRSREFRRRIQIQLSMGQPF
jgi:hypothetical protein